MWKYNEKLLLTIAFWAFLCCDKVASQDAKAVPTSDDLTHLLLERARKDREHHGEEISPELRSTIIDKERIAEEAHDRLVGLRERGNPHIRRGLRLHDIEENPERIRVDTKKMREERIRMIRDRQSPQPSEYRVVSREVNTPQPTTEVAKVDEAPDEVTPEGFPWVASVLGVGMLVGVIGGLGLRWLQARSEA
jgi:hypothetical protein